MTHIQIDNHSTYTGILLSDMKEIGNTQADFLPEPPKVYMYTLHTQTNELVPIVMRY